MSKVEKLNKLALKLTGSNPYKKTIKESLESIATYLAGENIEVENIEDAIQKCTEYYSGGGGGAVVIPDGIKFASSLYSTQPEWFATADWGNVLNFESIFQYNENLTAIDIDIIHSLSSNGLNTQYMFTGCSKLVSINLGNVDNIDRGNMDLWNFTNMFSKCPLLDDNTLNMIMKLLPKLRPTSPKTLSGFGISSTQATRCQSLSNYAAFTAAGWTTGY